LPFFWLAAFVVYFWTRRSFGEPAAFFATLTFTVLPPALAHAGLATTDMALTATLGAAFLALLLWTERPSPLRTGLFAVTLAAAILSKFSSLAFLPAAALAALACYIAFERPRAHQIVEWMRPRALPFATALVIASALVWAGYRFLFDRFPAPELWQGICDVQLHNREGHVGYLLGRTGDKGWWYYYAVALGVKTPLAMLALLCVGAFASWRKKGLTPLAFALGILLFASFYSHINLGIRHVLPVYIGFSIVAGIGAQWLWSSGIGARALLVGLLAWMVVSSAASHPDYLAYFNAIAGDKPERILVDSDLDWGQDMKRLARRLKELGVTKVAFDPFNKSYVEQLGSEGEFPRVTPLDPRGPAQGWNAASLTMLKLFRLGLYRTNPRAELWTDRIPPEERVGKSVLLWYIP
jgi:4-amino-4-deoxy-L-arabinose transferase-like glycosyltransferase